MRDHNFVSMGLNPNNQITCGWPKCAHLKADGNSTFGWCTIVQNRTPASKNWPTGFEPSVSFFGGCDHHPDRSSKTVSAAEEKP